MNMIKSGALKTLLLGVFFSCVMGAWGNAAYGQITWDGGAGDNLWSSAANWSTDIVPTSTDDVQITSTSGDIEVNVDINAVCNTLQAGGLLSSANKVTLIISSSQSLSISDFDVQGIFGGIAEFQMESNSELYISGTASFPSILNLGSNSRIIFNGSSSQILSIKILKLIIPRVWP